MACASSSSAGRWMPHDLPPWAIVYQQTQRWLQAGVFETMVHDLRLLLRDHAGRKARPTAAIFDSRTLQSSPESGHRAGWDGACPSGTRSGKRKKGSKIHIAVDTPGHLLAARVTPADEQDRAQVEALAATAQQVTARSRPSRWWKFGCDLRWPWVMRLVVSFRAGDRRSGRCSARPCLRPACNGSGAASRRWPRGGQRR